MTLKRATSMAEMRACLAKFATPEGIAKGLAYEPAASDVFITPYGKCGTTWTQQIVHGLRTRGSMEFSEITEVVPWLELAHDLNLDIFAPQAAHPRAFKSHLSFDAIPKGGRYINVFRRPEDALVSMFRFLEGWWFETGSISLSDFAVNNYLVSDGGHDYWHHAASWWRQRDNENVLLLCYEHMKHDLPGTVKLIADFIGCSLDAGLHELVVEQSSIAFMKKHASQFDDHLVREARDEICGVPAGGNSSKVRTGSIGDGNRELPADLIEVLNERWEKTMTREFGLASYRDLLDQCGH